MICLLSVARGAKVGYTPLVATEHAIGYHASRAIEHMLMRITPKALRALFPENDHANAIYVMPFR
jgi:hypothetical protein